MTILAYHVPFVYALCPLAFLCYEKILMCYITLYKKQYMVMDYNINIRVLGGDRVCFFVNKMKFFTALVFHTIVKYN